MDYSWKNYYKAYNINDLEGLLDKVILNNQDYMKEWEDNVKSTCFPQAVQNSISFLSILVLLLI